MRTLSYKQSILLLCIAAAVLLAGGLYRYHYLPDDTFVTLRYARNAMRGEGFVWNSGERVEGYTNFLWLLMLAGLGKLGAPLLETARLLSMVFSLSTLLLIYRLSSRPPEHTNVRGFHEAFANMLPVLFLCSAPPFLVWSLSGTEIPLFTFLLLAGFFLVERNERAASALLAFGLAGFVRPEGTMFFAVALAILILRYPEKRDVFLWGGAVIASYIIYAIWKWNYFHAILPNTFYAKTGPFSIMISNGMQYLSKFFVSYGYLLVAGIFISKRAGKKNFPLSIPIAFVAANWASILVLGGDWMPHFRLLLPTLPISVVVASRAVTEALEKRHLPFAATLGVFLVLLPGTVGYELFLAERTSVVAFERLGKRFAEILPPGTSLACGSIGAIGFYSDLPVIDILGLTDSWIARHGKIVSSQPGHLKTDGEYILERSPDLLLFGNVWIHRGVQSREEMRIKIQERDIIAQPSFEKRYRFVNIPLGWGFYLSCFKREGYFLPVDTGAE